MPINNITQTISTIPPAGARGVDVQTLFVTKQEDFQDHLVGTTVTELNTLKNQLNSRIGEINSTTTTMNGYANTASAEASTATTKAGEASTSASGALTSRNQAETFKNNASTSASKASQWADNYYNVAVETGRYSAKHWSTVAQNATANKVDKVTSTDNAIVRFNGTTGDVKDSGALIDSDGNLLLTSGTGGIGYGTGSGGTVTQLTSKSTEVTLNKPTGQIIMNNGALASNATAGFYLNSNLILNTDIFYVKGIFTGTVNPENYIIDISIIQKGAAKITVKNISGSSLSEAVVLNFIIIRGANL